MDEGKCLFCGQKYQLDLFWPFCPDCHEPLLYAYPRRPRDFNLKKTMPLERFIDFLPLGQINKSLSLGEGNTPLLKLSHLSQKYGLPPILAKMEMSNPTASFKDRGSVVAIQKAVSLGLKRIGTVSTGNMASSTAAYAARAGLKAYVLVKEDALPEKLLAAGIYHPVLLSVKGDYGQLFYDSFRVGREQQIYFSNSVDPHRIEGYKITAYEIFLNLGQQPPTHIIVPVSSGGHLIGLIKAYLDLKEEGLIEQLPMFIGVQAQGCSPIVKAYKQGKTKVERIEKIKTIAQTISNPYPPGGNLVLKLISENKGQLVAVSDKEILAAQKILAEEEGIFCMPASATVLAALLKLSKKIKFSQDDQVVLIITGSGLRAMKVLKSVPINIQRTSLADLAQTIKAFQD